MKTRSVEPLALWINQDRNWIVLFTFVLLSGILWMNQSRIEPQTNQSILVYQPPQSPQVGFSAPNFTLDLIDGGQMTLSDLRGQAVMINMWASWCPPCKEEMPAIQRVYQKYRDQGFVVLAVNTTYQDSESDAIAFVNNFGLTFPVPLDRTGKVAELYQLKGLPSTYFIDREGIIQDIIVGGPIKEALIESRVKTIIQGDK